MCLLYTRIDGVKYNLQQMRAMYEKTAEENALLKKELEESKKREALANKLYEDEKRKNAKLKEQLADFPKRGKDGKFIKNND